ncbi:MAG: glycerol-3-phosphate dehydrogenase/oxidase [Chryseosolibacter sp.]
MVHNIGRGIAHDFDRNTFLRQAEKDPDFDVIIIGGGATGLGIALDSASRGFRTLLLEQADFAKGTSSRSTKLVHGGVRYLAQGDIKLVYEALFERGLLLKNAPHLVSMQRFVIPNYHWWGEFLYGLGLKIYDWMAWRYRFTKTSLLSRQSVVELMPNLQEKGLKGGVAYYDGQFDDARLAINIAQTCAGQGGLLINYMKVVGLVKDESGKVCGVDAEDAERKGRYRFRAKAVVNATGVFVDEVLRMDSAAGEPLVRPSQGVHIVLDKSFLEGENALMIPSTEDGRVLFAVPWHDHLLVGTTDTPLERQSLEPVALAEEVAFILKTLRQYLVKKPAEKDILSVYAGLRPLAAQGKESGKTKEISRSHKLITAASGLITITGGKWTTYRKMAEDTVDEVIKVARLRNVPCRTTALKIHGHLQNGTHTGHWQTYGSDAVLIRAMASERPELKEQLHPAFPHIKAEVVWAVHHEMARTVEDVLARRLRILFLNASVAMDVAPEVARLMANELDADTAWQDKQIKDFSMIAANYLPALVPVPSLA